MPVKAIIVDIDGTIADLSHRRHHVSGTSKNWTKFFDEMGDDLPFQTVIDTINKLVLNNEDDEFAFFICTGRPENYRAETIAWLDKYAPPIDAQSNRSENGRTNVITFVEESVCGLMQPPFAGIMLNSNLLFRSFGCCGSQTLFFLQNAKT